jgi:glucose-6-phosphate 1-dehydrogenase
MTKKIDPAILVIFGITGDLSRKKLLPSLYQLFKGDLLPEDTTILGLTRQDLKVDQILKDVELCINEEDGLCDPKALNKIKQRLNILQIDISKLGEFKKLKTALDEADKKAGKKLNRLFYMSVPPKVTENIAEELGKHGMNGEQSRLLIEKPFGYDYKSAKKLIKTVSKYFDENQIFRIDHYLAKETVQNILVFRKNNIFEKIWDGKNISQITITAFEKLDIEGRKVFYEETGALRDLIQSHLLMLLAITILQIPDELSSTSLHKAKSKALGSINPVHPSELITNTVRAQYIGYREEVENQDSNIETFAAIKLRASSKRWHNTTFILQTGKALDNKLTEIEVVFRSNSDNAIPNKLTFRIQPQEDIKLKLFVKQPGFEEEIKSASLTLNYKTENIDVEHPDAYERVIVDAFKGDRSLFSTSEEILASWKIVDPIIKNWTSNSNNLELYKKGSSGPDISSITNN